MNRIALILGLCLAAMQMCAAAEDTTKCKEGETFIPYPNDCSKYYSCVNGVGHPMSCPDGYMFNPAKSMCDYPGQIDEKYCPKYECTQNEIYYLPSKTSCSQFILCYDGTPVIQDCADGLEFDGEKEQCVLEQDSSCLMLNCPAEAEGPVFLPDKKDCQSYYICHKGEPIKQKCVDGLHWNDAAKQCQPPAEAGCKKLRQQMQDAAMIPQSQPSTFTIACPLFGISFLPSPTECDYFFGCNNGKSHLFQCPAGTAFDTKSRKCVLRTTVDRCYFK